MRNKMKERLLDLMIEAKKEEPDDAVWSDWLCEFLIDHGVFVPLEGEKR